MTRFTFWGLFAVFGGIVLAYWLWMRRLERRERDDAKQHEQDTPNHDETRQPAGEPSP